MRTEDDVASDLRRKVITPEQALIELDAGQVLVYAALGHDPATATEADVEEGASGSTLLHAFWLAGADETMLGLVSDQVMRLRDQGLTIETYFPRSTWYGEGEPR